MKQRELTREELLLKEICRNHPERRLDAPHQMQEVRDVLRLAFDDSTENMSEENLEEPIFIPEDLDVFLVWHERYLPSFWHRHSFFELSYVLSGSVTNDLEGKRLLMHQGDISILAPGISHAVGAFEDNAVMANILIRESTFEETFLAKFRGDDILSTFFTRAFYQSEGFPYLLFHTGEDSSLASALAEMEGETKGHRSFRRQMLNVCLQKFFLELLRHHESHIDLPELRLMKGSENLIYILQYMQTHWNSVTLKEMSSFFHYSERQLQRIIKAATGRTFEENTQAQKMLHAKTLLTTTTLPVSDVAERCGFSSLNNFRRIFGRTYGMTPRQFRQSSSV